MQRLSSKQRLSLETAAEEYEKHVMRAASYLAERRISVATAMEARLGVVVSPIDETHEAFVGRLVVPYLNKSGVYGMKFRCIQPHDCKAVNCPKYLNVPGIETGVYGVLDVDEVSEVIHICEGEMDRLSLKQVLQQPTVGFPGANSWKPHHHCHFQGFDRVLVWAHPDKAGGELAARIRKEIPIVEVVRLPDGMDVNQILIDVGPELLLHLAGLGEVDHG